MWVKYQSLYTKMILNGEIENTITNGKSCFMMFCTVLITFIRQGLVSSSSKNVTTMPNDQKLF